MCALSTQVNKWLCRAVTREWWYWPTGPRPPALSALCLQCLGWDLISPLELLGTALCPCPWGPAHSVPLSPVPLGRFQVCSLWALLPRAVQVGGDRELLALGWHHLPQGQDRVPARVGLRKSCNECFVFLNHCSGACNFEFKQMCIRWFLRVNLMSIVEARIGVTLVLHPLQPSDYSWIVGGHPVVQISLDTNTYALPYVGTHLIFPHLNISKSTWWFWRWM